MYNAFYEISRDDFKKAKEKGPKCLINEGFKRDHEIYDAKVTYVKHGHYYLSFKYEKKIYKG